jgi:trehalose 6-phosphate phosphatase
VSRLLLGRHRSVLEGLAAGRTLLAFDYDGVLAPLRREDPAGLGIGPATARLLSRVAARWPVAVVSGRSFADARRLARGIPHHVVGNHGFEDGRTRPVPAAVRARVQRWRRELEERLAGQAGWWIEDKASTLSVHFGLRRRWRAVGREVERAARRLEGARLVPGKQVLNVVPRSFPHKGDAVLALLGRLSLDAALFVGDDVTDEDAFAVGPPRVVGVRVGPGPTRAPWRLRDRDEVDDLLRLLLGLRAAGAGPD